MLKLIRNHQKKFLAFFGVGLMITFVVQTGYSRGGGSGGRRDVTVGTVNGNKPILSSELEEAKHEWRAVQQYVLIPVGGQYSQQRIPYTQVAFGRDPAFGQQMSAMIEQKPEVLALLRREARDAGVRADENEVETILANYYTNTGNDDINYLVRQGVTDIALIEANFNRIASDIKISAPLREKVLARVLQLIQVNALELSANDYANKVPPPTTQQIEDQFTKYADVAPPQQPDPKNPFGFGYRLPDRVKVQYLAIDRAQVQKAVERKMSPYEWDVQARLYYRQHKDEFPTTQPAPPTTQSTAVSAATSQPSTAPAYRPYNEVAKDALRDVQDPMVDKLMFDIQTKITAQLANDWRTYQQSAASAGAGASTAPSATAAGDYPSYKYLKKLADSIQKQFDVTVFANDFDRFYSADELNTLPGIGQLGETAFGRAGVKFSDVAMQRAAPYLSGSADKRTAAARAQLMQPSPPLPDATRDVYIFRLTDARPAEPATDLNEVRAKVEMDLRKAAGYDVAKAAAKPALEAAQSGSLNAEAMAMGKRVITTDPFNSNPYTNNPPTLGGGINLSPAAARDVAEQAFGLLAQYNPTTNAHPVKLIELPEDGKLYVAQLTNITPQWDTGTFYSRWLDVSAGLRQGLANGLRSDWFNYDAVIQRTGYKPDKAQQASAD